MVYAKRPFGGPKAVLAYLNRNKHRLAISNHPLINTDAHTVAFRWKEYRIKRGDRMKVIRLTADEFIRRFLIPALPSGFHRIRYTSLLANGIHPNRIAKIRYLIDAMLELDQRLVKEEINNP